MPWRCTFCFNVLTSETGFRRHLLFKHRRVYLTRRQPQYVADDEQYERMCAKVRRNRGRRRRRGKAADMESVAAISLSPDHRRGAAHQRWRVAGTVRPVETIDAGSMSADVPIVRTVYHPGSDRAVLYANNSDVLDEFSYDHAAELDTV